MSRIAMTLLCLSLLFTALPGCFDGNDNDNTPVDGDASESDPDETESDGDSEIDGEPEQFENDIEPEVEYHQDINLEAARPQIHYTPLSGWMNDPNGLVYYKGEYHLFHQYAPEGFFQSAMHWGHAVSADLVHWEYLPAALFPDDEMGNVYSGSAVVDWQNSSGLCETDEEGNSSCLVALFTHSGGTDGAQKQSLAYSNDSGRTWTMYAENPVLANPGIKDFRDPKVFYYSETSRWIMLISKGHSLAFYSSENLIDWVYESDFSMDLAEDFKLTWECPELFRLPVENENNVEKWVLKVDVFDGGPYGGGSHGQYFVGDFDGHSFSSETATDEFQWINYGRDFYASQSWSDIPTEDGRRIWIAWMNNWNYAIQIGKESWQGAMSLPRELSLRSSENETGTDYRIIERPIKELEELRSRSLLDDKDIEISTENSLPIGPLSAPYEVICEIEDPGAGEICMEIFSSSDSAAPLCIDFDRKSIRVERNSSAAESLNADFPGVHATPEGLQWSNPLRLHMFVDRSSVEVFIDDSQYAITELLPAVEGDSELLVSITGEATVKLRSIVVYELRSIWACND